MAKTVSSMLRTLDEMLHLGQIREGDWFRMPVDPEKSYSIASSKSGWENDQEFKNRGKKYIIGRCAMHSNYGVKIVFEPTDFGIFFMGLDGSMNGEMELQRLCDALYSRPEYAIGVHSMNVLSWKQMPEELKYTQTKYWLSSRYTVESLFSRIGRLFTNQYTDRYRSFGLYTVDANNANQYTLRFLDGKDKIGYFAARPETWISSDNDHVSVVLDHNHDGKTRLTAYEIQFFDPLCESDYL